MHCVLSPSLNGISSVSRLQLATVADYDTKALQRLANQNHVYDRMDWWPLDEWRHSNAFIGLTLRSNNPQRRLFASAPKPNELSAALLALPIDYRNPQQLESATSAVAWIRWCAVMNTLSPTTAVTLLLQELVKRLQATCVKSIWCIGEKRNWMGTCVQENGFTQVDELITLRYAALTVRIPPLPRHARIRVLRSEMLTEDIIKAIQHIDNAAFAPQWYYSPHMLREAFGQSYYVTIMERAGVVLGYQCATLYDGDAHIVRLAVAPAEQGRGVGSALLADCVRELRLHGAREITLNTPGTNTVSQQLYQRMGFATVRQPLAAFQYQL